VKTKQTKMQRINAMMAKHPDMKPREIAKRLGVDIGLVYQVRYETKKNSEFVNKVFTKAKKKQSRIVEAVEETNKEVGKLFSQAYEKYQTDLVNHPAHYKAGGIETINFIEAKDLNYRLGNVVKYVSRAGKKDSDPVQDLEKAAWYLNREIEARKRA